MGRNKFKQSPLRSWRKKKRKQPRMRDGVAQKRVKGAGDNVHGARISAALQEGDKTYRKQKRETPKKKEGGQGKGGKTEPEKM